MPPLYERFIRGFVVFDFQRRSILQARELHASDFVVPQGSGGRSAPVPAWDIRTSCFFMTNASGQPVHPPESRMMEPVKMLPACYVPKFPVLSAGTVRLSNVSLSRLL